MSQFNEHNIDDLFEKTFEDLSLDMQGSDDLWRRIEAERKPKKRTFLLWLWAGMFLLLASFGFWYLQSNSENIEIISKQTISETVKPTKRNRKELPKVSAQKILEEDANFEKTERDIPVKEPTVKMDKTSLNSIIKQTQNKAVIPSSNKDVATKPINKSLYYSSSYNVENPDSFKKWGNAHDKQKGSLAIDKSLAASIETKSSINKSFYFHLLPRLKRKSFVVADCQSDILKNKINESLRPKPNTETVGFQHGISISSGLFSVQSEKISNQQSLEFLNVYNSIFTTLSSFSTAVCYTISKRKLNLSVGVEWQHIETQYENIGINESIRILELNPEAFVLQEENLPPLFYANESYGSLVTKYHEFSKVTQQSVNIPIQLSYALPVWNGISIGPKIGVIMNIYNKHNGRYLSNNLKPVYYDLEDQNALNHNIGLQLVGGLNIKLSINDNWVINIDPAFRYNTRNTYNHTYAISEYQHLLGGQLGIQWVW